MTDEEKAKEYVNKIKRQYLLSEEGLGCAEQGYLDGLAEGRKEELGYEKCLEDVYAELEKIRKSESDFFIREATDIVRLKLKLEFMHRSEK